MTEDNLNELAAKANRLYWQTTRPAGHLADELDVSRSKFYALIEPLRLGVTCDICGDLLAFNSRSDRDAGRGRCPACGHTAQVPAEAIPPTVEGNPPPPSAPEAAVSAATATAETGDLWLSALAGVALGLVAGAVWRRR